MSDITMPDQIILATDLSPASNAAVSIASRAALIFKAKVTILHVFPYVAPHRYKIPVEWMIEIIRRDVQSKLDKTKRTLSELGIQAEVMIVEDGIPSQQILDFVQSCGTPLLVMGTHAVGGMERFLIGSTAEEVLRQARCPVITVGPHVAPAAGNDPYFHKVLYATDFSEASLAAVPLAVALRRSSAASLRVLHVSAAPVSPAPDEDQRFDPIRQALRVNGAGISVGSEEYVTLHGKDVSQAVVNEAERYSADLLVLGVHRASAYASHLAPKITFQIIAAAPCAVLTVSSRDAFGFLSPA
jgi:nucleotide-binding universal stress UspA family protein